VTVEDGGRVTVGGAVGALVGPLSGAAGAEAVVARGAEDSLPATGFDRVTSGEGAVGFEGPVAGAALVRAAVVSCAGCPSTCDEHPASSNPPTTRSGAPNRRRPGRSSPRAGVRRDAERSVFMIPRR
jgi:hypothetical protein